MVRMLRAPSIAAAAALHRCCCGITSFSSHQIASTHFTIRRASPPPRRARRQFSSCILTLSVSDGAIERAAAAAAAAAAHPPGEQASCSLQDDVISSSAKGELESGLYLVATPIGNLEDITLRALRVLKSADLILTEDTRHSAKLLQHYGIRTPSSSYHKFNEARRSRFVIERLRHGGALALISDAGMPGVSDPGAELVKACLDANIHVFPIPGPCAVITALVASGLPTNEFSFFGFLSTQGSERRNRLALAANEVSTQVLYVPPHKLCRILEDCIAVFGGSRRCVVAREMTKIHEEFWRGTLEEASTEFSSRSPRGEITLVIQGRLDLERSSSDEEIQQELQRALDNNITISEAAKLVAQKLSVKKSKVYDLALKLAGKNTTL